MSCDPGNNGGIGEKVTDAPSCSLSKKPVDNCKFSSKEHQLALLLWNSQPGYTFIITDTPLKFISLFPAQKLEQRKQLNSGDQFGTHALETLGLSPTIFVQVGLQKEQSRTLSEVTELDKTFLPRTHMTNAAGQSRSRKKRTKPVKSSSASSANCCLSGSPVVVSDNSDGFCSDILIQDIPEEDKPVKRSSKKKGKKKGKQYKRSSRKKVSSAPGQSKDMATISVSGDPVLSSGLVDNLSNKAYSSVKGIAIRKEGVCAKPIEPHRNQESMDVCFNYVPDAERAVHSLEINRYTTTESTMIGYPVEDNTYYQGSSCSSLDQSTPSTEGSLAQCWNSDPSGICNNDVETHLSVKDEGGPSSFGSGADFRMGDTLSHKVVLDSHPVSSKVSQEDSLSRSCRVNDAIDFEYRDERVQCSSEASCSKDFHPVIYGKKRGRLSRKTTGASNVANQDVTMKSMSGKDSNHSVWLKVQKNGPVESGTSCSKGRCRSLDNAPGLSEKRVSLENMVPKRSHINKPCKNMNSYTHVHQEKLGSCSVVSNGTSKLTNKKPTKDVKRRSDSAARHSNHSSWKGLHSAKANISRPSESPMQQKDEPKKVQQVIQDSDMCQESVASCSNYSHKPLTELNGGHLEQEQEMEVDMGKSTPGVGYSDVSTLTLHAKLIGNRQPQQKVNILGDYCCSVDTVDDTSMKLEAESFRAECSKPGSCYGSMLQKWVPVGRKGPLSLKPNDEMVPDSPNRKNVEVHMVSDLNNYLPHSRYWSDSSSGSYEDAQYFQISEANELSPDCKDHLQSEEELKVVHSASSSQLTLKMQSQCPKGTDNDLGLILQAVFDARKFQIASESILHATGNPIAEFERFIHSASPVLSEVHCTRSCRICTEGKVVEDSSYLHQISDFSLGSLWQWYERPGSYGLEVKADNLNHRDLRYNCCKFRAFFVPYLSAVQLFGRSKKAACTCDRGTCSKQSAVLTEKELVSLKSLPIFSKLVPQTCKELGLSCSCSPAENHYHQQGIEGELLFEYFETDQPQQRRPLFEKIKELVRGNPLSSSNMFGDPAHLGRLKSQDLHPSSWYCVAWYPIYRIPDGNFRAAFLTYHSLGYFTSKKVQWSDKSYLTLPVVGLQSYNAKGECWFETRNLKPQQVSTEATEMPDTSKILKERLRTLEQTASLMARASVVKDKKICINKQPDYEFFLSRRQ